MRAIKKSKLVIVMVLFSFPVISVSAADLVTAQQLFKQKCSLCHGLDKKKLGPAIKVMSKEASVLRGIISKGKKPMPAYDGKLTSAEIDALVEYILVSQ